MLTIFALLGVTFHHLVSIFEARESHLSDRVLLMVSFVRRQERCVGSEREMDAGKAV